MPKPAPAPPAKYARAKSAEIANSKRLDSCKRIVDKALLEVPGLRTGLMVGVGAAASGTLATCTSPLIAAGIVTAAVVFMKVSPKSASSSDLDDLEGMEDTVNTTMGATSIATSMAAQALHPVATIVGPILGGAAGIVVQTAIEDASEDLPTNGNLGNPIVPTIASTGAYMLCTSAVGGGILGGGAGIVSALVAGPATCTAFDKIGRMIKEFRTTSKPHAE